MTEEDEQPVLLTDLVGLKEIRQMFEGSRPGKPVEQNTVDMWRLRKVLPKEDTVFSGSPVWRRQRIVDWGRETGRKMLDAQDPAA